MNDKYDMDTKISQIVSTLHYEFGYILMQVADECGGNHEES